MKTDPHITVLTARLGRKEENYEKQILITKSIIGGEIIGGENYEKDNVGNVRRVQLCHYFHQ